jgi:hypothetical protein
MLVLNPARYKETAGTGLHTPVVVFCTASLCDVQHPHFDINSAANEASIVQQ